MNQSITCGGAGDTAAADVLGRALAGDAAAFEQLLVPLIPPAHRLAYALLRDQAAAEDAVQDACLSAWFRLRQLRAPESTRSWFLAIVANRCRSVMRRRPTLLFDTHPELADVQPGPEARLEILSLRAGLGRLPVQDRLILYLRYVEDLSQEEIARVAGVRLGAARSRLHRALQRLRRELGQELTP